MIAHKAVSAYDINSVFALHLAPEELFGGRPNLGPAVMAALETAYGEALSPEAVFHYVYAVLHSSGYRQSFEPFLREGFPRIPFPADAALFARLGAEGAALVSLHLLRAGSLGELRVRCTGDGRLPLSRRPVWEKDWEKDHGRVRIAGPEVSASKASSRRSGRTASAAIRCCAVGLARAPAGSSAWRRSSTSGTRRRLSRGPSRHRSGSTKSGERSSPERK